MAIASLGYIGLRASDLAAWRTFAVDNLGLEAAATPTGGLRLRCDEREWRIAIDPGEADDIACIGFECASLADLLATRERLEQHGFPVVEADPALIADRGVLQLLLCTEPGGLRIELFHGGTSRTDRPFVSPYGVRFVTGSQGLGHIALAVPDIVAARRFYVDALGFQLSDIIDTERGGEMVSLEFYHCNGRHHTLALLQAAPPKRLLHFMLQADDINAMGFALDRMIGAGHVITRSIGRHTNDEMISFYVRAPSGFEIEYGWGGLEIEGPWPIRIHRKISIWGHRPPSA